MSQPPYGQDPNQNPGRPSGQQGGYPPPGGQQQPYGPGGQQYGGQPGYGGQQPYGSQPGYGGQPDAGGYPQPGAAGATAPKEVETSFKLWLLYIGISLISSILGFLGINALIDAQLRAQGLDLADAPPGFAQGLQIGLIAGAVFGLVLLAAIVAVVFQMRKGRNWARIVLAVLGGISVLSGVVGLFGIGTALATGVLGVIGAILSVAQLIVLIAALVFMFRGAANPYFAARR